MTKHIIEYQSVFFGNWIPLFINDEAEAIEYDSYTKALKQFTEHVNAMIDSGEGDDIDLSDYRIRKV